MATAPETQSAGEREGALELGDGRTLSYAQLGADGGPTVVVLDGPGSRGLARAAAPAAAQLGVRLVAPDRPGFLGSTPRAGRAIVDWPGDLLQLADRLGLAGFGVLGQSGGTPYALATAAAAPDRVHALALTGAVTPLGEPGAIDDVRGPMRPAMILARRAPWLLRPLLAIPAREARRDPEKAAARALTDLPPRDAAVMAEPGPRAMHVQTTGEILAHTPAMADELRLLAQRWNVDLAAIRAPVRLWVGERDTTHPPSMSHRLASYLPGSPEVTIVPDAATFGLADTLPDVLRFAAPPVSR